MRPDRFIDRVRDEDVGETVVTDDVYENFSAETFDGALDADGIFYSDSGDDEEF